MRRFAVLSVLVCFPLMAAHSAHGVGPNRAYSWPEMQEEQARMFFTDPTVPAPGVNRWDCTPSERHPHPVVLVHGFQNNQFNNWAYLGPTLANEGYCVFSLNHGGIIPPPFVFQGLGDVDRSAHQVAAFVDQVLVATKASKVDLIGHSLGGFMVEYAPKVMPGLPAKVRTVVAIAPPTHGVFTGLTSVLESVGLIRLLSFVVPVAPTQLLAGSVQQQRLHDGGVTVPGINYTVIASGADRTIAPHESFITEPGVTNILVQDVCPHDPVGHSGQSYDSGVVTMVTNALDPRHQQPVVCVAGPTS